MTSVILIFLATLAAVSLGEDQNQCQKIAPQKDVDWSKLVGPWYKLMFHSGGSFFLNCRKMDLNVNKDKQVVNIDFDNKAYGRNPKFVREDSVHFKWEDEPGIVLVSITAEREYSKLSSKFHMRRKSSTKGMLDLKTSTHTLVSTDYSNYIAMVNCVEGVRTDVWLSIKETTIQSELAQTIKDELLLVGVDASQMDFNSTLSCLV